MSSEDEYSDAFEASGCPPWIIGERKLLGAILRQAICDLTTQGERGEAIQWLTQEAVETDQFTLPWICEILGMDFEGVKMMVANKIKETDYYEM